LVLASLYTALYIGSGQGLQATNWGPLAGMAKSRMNCAAPTDVLYVVWSAEFIAVRGVAKTRAGRSV
jgi:hypothetical protein